MVNGSDKFGIIIAIAITAAALAFVSNAVTNPENISMQPQGEEFLEKTVNEITNTPSTLANSIDDSIDKVEDISNEIEDIVEEVEDIEKISELPQVIDEAEDIVPEIPAVVQQTEGDLLEMIVIPEGTSIPDCEITNTCYIPATAVIQASGEIIWDNMDTAAHTVTSGDPKSGPNGIFDSGLMMPGDTYSVKLDIPNIYDYFCVVHPWMTGQVTVK